MVVLQVNNLKKVYTTRFGGTKVEALKDINFSVEEGEYVAIMGESGSGKTTLLNLLAAIDKPTAGQIMIKGNNTVTIKDHDMAKYRREHLGFVFQDFNLLDTFTVEDSIMLPLVLAGEKYQKIQPKLEQLLTMLGIEGIRRKFPYEISGGQKQRTAVARALITNPDLLLADEPTGALDSKSAKELLDIFSDIQKQGQTILMVTHSTRAASHAGRVLFIKDGELFHQIYRGDMSDDTMYKKISDTLSVLMAGGDKNE